MDCSSRPYEVLASFSVSHRGTRSSNDHKKVGGSRKPAGKGVKLSTDAQSIAARERRHRISERFKILQSLVPGGNKLDTVSMLEEAILYVKFLKTQIWLHQNIINFADAVPPNLLFFPNYLFPHQIPNMAAEEHAFLPQMQFPHSANSSSSYDEEIMAMPFDANMPY